MDYFSIAVLVIVVFVFITDRKIKSIEQIQKEDENIFFRLEKIKQNLKIIDIKEKDMLYDTIKGILTNVKEEYVLIKNDKLSLVKENVNTVIANYINCKSKPCGFNLTYKYEGKKNPIKRACVDIINYLNIFNKQDLKTYGVIFAKKEDFENDEKDFKQVMLPYTSTDFTNMTIVENQIKKGWLKKLYIQKIDGSKFSIIIKLMLLIISGSFITSNLIYAVVNIKNNFTSLVLALVIYYCYSYIIRYVYSPIGKHRIVASYIFPVYFLAYVFISIYMLILKVIKKVQAS